MILPLKASQPAPLDTTREEGHFPFADKPASLLPKPNAPKGTQGKDYSLPDLLCNWDPSSYTAVQVRLPLRTSCISRAETSSIECFAQNLSG